MHLLTASQCGGSGTQPQLSLTPEPPVPQMTRKLFRLVKLIMRDRELFLKGTRRIKEKNKGSQRRREHGSRKISVESADSGLRGERTLPKEAGE